MKIINYTSEIPAQTTISHIEAYLAECNVQGVTKQYENKVPVALFFHITVNGRNYSIRLPAKVSKCQDWLWRKYCASVRNPRKTKADFLEQATRTAWAVQRDWMKAQMTIIALDQADFMEVFMGFVWEGNQSHYERVKASGYKEIPEHAGS